MAMNENNINILWHVLRGYYNYRAYISGTVFHDNNAKTGSALFM